MTHRLPLLALLLLLLVPGTALAAGPEFPPSWYGVWDFFRVDRVCVSGTLIQAEPAPDTLCAGDGFNEFDDFGEVIDCTGTITDTRIDVDCSGSIVNGGCTQNISVTITGTRTGDRIEALQTTTFTYVEAGPGDCNNEQDSCMTTDIDGLLLSAGTADCPTPVVSLTWGTLKARY